MEAVGIEPYCRRYANPTRTLGFPAYRFVKHATRALTRVPCNTLESPRLPWALVIIWSLTNAARASLNAVVFEDAGQVRCWGVELSTRQVTLARVDHASEARRAQITRFRQMTPGERWTAARDLYWSVRRLKEAFIRQQHPDWSNDQVAAAVREAFSHVRD